MTFDNLFGYILSLSMCMQNFITIFHSVQEIGPFSLFQNLELGKASTDDKCHFSISWARSCQYQCVCKSLVKYSECFTSYRQFSLFVRGQNLHKQSGDKNKCLRHTLKVNLQLQLTFLGSCNQRYNTCVRILNAFFTNMLNCFCSFLLSYMQSSINVDIVGLPQKYLLISCFLRSL